VTITAQRVESISLSHLTQSPHVVRIALREHFDDDSPLISRPQHRVNRRQTPSESYIHDAAAHRDDHAMVR
jgi:hypothetical protein